MRKVIIWLHLQKALWRLATMPPVYGYETVYGLIIPYTTEEAEGLDMEALAIKNLIRRLRRMLKNKF